MILEICFKPHDKQLPFMQSNAKYRAIITGVGFGKTSVGVVEMIRDLLCHPGTLNLIFAPTTPMLKNVTMAEFFKWCPKELIISHNQTEHRIMFANNSQLIYLSGDNERNIDRMRGLNIGAAYGDEIRMSPEYVWKIIIGRLRHQKGSMRAWITTTPAGFNWIYNWFVLKKHTSRPDDYEFFTGSSLDNPHTPEEYKETLMSTLTGAFLEQEVYGKFVGFEGCVYSEFRRDVHVGRYKNKNFKQYIGGIDWGWTNPSACLIIGIDGDNRVYVIEEVYEKRVHTEQFAGIVKEKKEGKEIVFQADPSEPALIEEFNSAGISTVPADNDLLPGIQKVGSLLKAQEDGKPRLYVDEDCVNTIMEFENYRYPDVKEGRPEQEKPLKIFDHLLDCLRYAVMGMQKEVEFGILEM